MIPATNAARDPPNAIIDVEKIAAKNDNHLKYFEILKLSQKYNEQNKSHTPAAEREF